MIRAVLAATLALLSGCAHISAVPLSPDGTEAGPVGDKAQGKGVRYYLPKPYILITELPSTSSGGDGSSSAASAAASGDSSSSKSKSAASDSTSTPSAPTSNTSFAASMASYSVKLIYLPDFSKPMALDISGGIWGSISVAPTLQDGWMLGALSASVDSGLAATITALAGFKPAASSGGGSGGGKGGGGSAAVVNPSNDLAPKGVNPKNPDFGKFANPDIKSYGVLVGKLEASPPTPADVATLNKEQIQLFVQSVADGARIKAEVNAELAKNPGPTWGDNVLPAGLYEFNYDGGGRLLGLKPLMFFCHSGIEAPKSDSTPCEHS